MKTNNIVSLAKNVARYVKTRLIAGPNMQSSGSIKSPMWAGRIEGTSNVRPFKQIVLRDVSIVAASSDDGAGCTYRAVGTVSHPSKIVSKDLFHVTFDPNAGQFTIDGMKTAMLKTLWLKDDGSVMGEFQPA